MQRVLPLFLILFALSACGTSIPRTPDDIQPEPPIGEAPVVEEPGLPTVGAEMPVLPEFDVEVPAPLPPIIEGTVPHIALLLPLKSALFGSASDVVMKGFMAAANLNWRGLPVFIYGEYDENSDVVDVYRQAIANGARAVVGPLTRNNVTALAEEKEIPVPTLTLNVVDRKPAPRLYFFGMVIEAEARQIARMARQQGMQQSIVIGTRTQISQRLQSAFEEEWHASGGEILREIEFNDDPAVLADITETSNTVVFLAASAATSRQIHPYLSNKFPVYSTSQIFIGNDKSLTNYDLNGIRFIDMPWLLQPDHPAVMIYPRARMPLSPDQERLYALGIDAYRLIQLLIYNRIDTTLPLDGVSGKIQLYGHLFLREAILAEFRQGQAQLSDVRTSLVPEVFPDRIINVP